VDQFPAGDPDHFPSVRSSCRSENQSTQDITMLGENRQGQLDSKVEALVQSLVRWRLVFLILTVVVPADCYGLFERQARRLDVLAATGEVTEATVTSLTKQGSSTFVHYSYSVGGGTHTSNQDIKNAPRAVIGESFPILYAPSDPDMNVTGTDRAKAAQEAASNRRFSSRFVAAVFAILAACAIATDVRLRRLRKSGLPDPMSPQVFRRRMAIVGVVLAVPCVAVSLYHLSDARERGEPVWPVALALLIVLAVVGGTILFALRDGPARAAVRSARALKWLVPIAVAIAVVRALVWQMTRN
jgi:hypothetical protein